VNSACGIFYPVSQADKQRISPELPVIQFFAWVVPGGTGHIYKIERPQVIYPGNEVSVKHESWWNGPFVGVMDLEFAVRCSVTS
jgi:hypothetical protein